MLYLYFVYIAYMAIGFYSEVISTVVKMASGYNTHETKPHIFEAMSNILLFSTF